VPLEFLRRRGGGASPAAAPSAPARGSSAPVVLPEEVVAQDHLLRLTFAGKTSEGVRLKAGPEILAELPGIIGEDALSRVEVVPPRAMDSGQASPWIIRTREAEAWLDEHGEASPITRHTLWVLEMLDAIDPAYDTLACALLDGTTDPVGYPDYSAIVGGVAAHWDESTGDLIVRAVVAWGGTGTRGDTDRIAARILRGLLENIVESSRVLGFTDLDRPVGGGGDQAVVCGHCGFSSAHGRAMYCPKCGMRLLRE
jgi:hypothetical protein